MAFSCWLKNELSLVLSISFVRKHLLRLGSVVELLLPFGEGKLNTLYWVCLGQVEFLLSLKEGRRFTSPMEADWANRERCHHLPHFLRPSWNRCRFASRLLPCQIRYHSASRQLPCQIRCRFASRLRSCQD